MPRLGHAFKPLGGKPRKAPAPTPARSRQVKFKPARPNYENIKRDVMQAIAQLPADKQAQIPLTGTLPEIMVALALVWLGWLFRCQSSELGGRLQVGGAVVDVIVYLGASQVVIRVQGDYWHSQPDRKLKDAAQWNRLHYLRFRVFDAWEHDIYQAWVEGRLKTFVEQGVQQAG